MKAKKPEFVLCPRCELNYMPTADKKRKYCDVCLAELNLVDPIILIPDEDNELEVLCPICKINYMSPEEEVCFLCAKERDKPIIEEADDWNFTEDQVVADEPIEISLSDLAEEEAEEDDEVIEEDDFEDILDDDDFDDYDDDEDEDEDDEDDDDF